MTKKFDYATPFAKTSSGIRGVSFDKTSGKWVAKIAYDNRRKNLGRFDTPEEAMRVYDMAAERIRDAHRADAIRKLEDKISFLVGK